MILKGTIKKIGDIQTFGSGFQKREGVILTNDTYPQSIPFEVVQDKIDILNPFKEGDEIEISINLKSREWVSPQGETKYFLSLQCWKAIKPNPIDTSGKVPQGKIEDAFPKDEDDDLPW